MPSDFRLAFSMLIGLFAVALICALCIQTKQRVGATIIDAPFGDDDQSGSDAKVANG
jgi:hypothetical protein